MMSSSSFSCGSLRIRSSVLTFSLLLMWGKRRKNVDQACPSPGKRLKSRFLDAFARGESSAADLAGLMQDAAAAGVSSCYSSQCERNASCKTITHGFIKEGTLWPSTFRWPVPTKDGFEDLEFLLPDEVLSVMATIGSLETLTSTAGLDSTLTRLHTGIADSWQSPFVAISIWGDGIPYSWDRSESIVAWCWSMPGLESAEHRRLRFPLTALPKHFVVDGTHERTLEVLVWSMSALSLGKFPSSKPDGTPWPKGTRQRKGGTDLGVKACVLECKGDWAHFADVLNLSRWRGGPGLCWRCNCTTAELTLVGLMLLGEIQKTGSTTRGSSFIWLNQERPCPRSGTSQSFPLRCCALIGFTALIKEF